MANGDVIAYNVAAFISTLFLLEFGADKFVDYTASHGWRRMGRGGSWAFPCLGSGLTVTSIAAGGHYFRPCPRPPVISN